MHKLFLILLLFCYYLNYAEDKLIISDIVISGNKVTKEEIILRELEFKNWGRNYGN